MTKLMILSMALIALIAAKQPLPSASIGGYPKANPDLSNLPGDLLELLSALVSSDTMDGLIDSIGTEAVDDEEAMSFINFVKSVIDHIALNSAPSQNVENIYIDYPLFCGWGIRISMMATIPFNMGSNDIINRDLAIELLLVYEKFLRLIEPKQVFRPLPIYLMDLWRYGHIAQQADEFEDSEIATPNPESRPSITRHDAHKCSVCRHISQGHLPMGTVHALTDVVLESTDSGTTLLPHINEAIRIISTQSLETDCDNAERIVRQSHRAISEIQDGEIFFPLVVPTMQFARKCMHRLSMDVRHRIIPELLLRNVGEIAYGLPAGLTVVVEQPKDHKGAFKLVTERILEYSLITDFTQLRVEFAGSEARGNGPLVALVANAVEDAVSELFEPIDDREVNIKPKVGADTEQLRMFGRLLAIVISHNVPVRLPLTRGALALLVRADLDAIPWMEWLELEDPQKHKGLANLLDGQEIFEGENVQTFAQRVARDAVLESIKEPVTQILYGIYDVIPIGALSWLHIDELEKILTGHVGPVNAETLKKHSDYTDVQETKWLWDIVSTDLDIVKIGTLLEFATGSRHAPFYRQQWMQVIVTGPDLDRLPEAQLCFRQLRLSKYSSREALKARLLRALEDCKTIDNI